MDVQLVAAGDPVDLGHGLVFQEKSGYLGKCVRGRLDLKIAGYRAVYLLRVDDCGVLMRQHGKPRWWSI